MLKTNICMIILGALCILLLSSCGHTVTPQATDTNPTVKTTKPPVETKAPPIDIKAPPANPTIVLLAEDADLSDAEDLILESEALPNLGNWKGGNEACWQFTVTTEGEYSVGLYYSRPYADFDAWGSMVLYGIENEDIQALDFQVYATSGYSDDWSMYHYTQELSFYLLPGEYWMLISPGSLDDEHPLEEDYFINLRSVILVLTEEGHSQGSYTIDDFQGRSYNYANDIWLEIEGERFTITYKSGEGISGPCVLEGDTLILNGEIEGDGGLDLTITPDGTLSAKHYGHFRPQDSDEPADSPMDLSADSYLGVWYCEEFDTTMTLKFNYLLELTIYPNGPDDPKTLYGRYEPYGNRLVLAEATPAANDVNVIYIGEIALYDPGTQTITTEEGDVYQRVTYGGGYKAIVPGAEIYDGYDWGSPYISKEKIAGDIIDTWRNNGENVDPIYLDVDSLVEAIDDFEWEADQIFVNACMIAGVDYTTYFDFIDWDE